MKVVTTTDYRLRALAALRASTEKVDVDTATARVFAGRLGAASADDGPRIAAWDRLISPASLEELQPHGTAAPTYDLTAYLAVRCALAYQRPAVVEATIAAQGGVDIQTFTHYPDFAVAYRRGTTAIVVFRGTVAWKLLSQWVLTNAVCIPVGPGHRHLGFLMAWRRLKTDVEAWLERTVPSGGDVIFAGHSLGGALAVLAAHELASRYPVRAVVTLGAPRAGTAGFRDAYLSTPSAPPGSERAGVMLAQVTRRMTHADDLISRVPPPPLFRHVGEEWRLDAEGRVTRGESRSISERFVTSFDQLLGRLYRRLDTATDTRHAPVEPMAPGASSIHPLASAPIRPPTPYVIPGLAAAPAPSSSRARLWQDTQTWLERYPVLRLFYLPLLHVGQLLLVVVGGLLSLAIALRGAFDFYAHKSHLYVQAMSCRYLVSTPFGPPISREAARHVADTFRKIKKST